MLAWFSENLATILVTAAVAAAAAVIVIRMIKNKKQGRSSCSCGGACAGCPMSGTCHKAK